MPRTRYHATTLLFMLCVIPSAMADLRTVNLRSIADTTILRNNNDPAAALSNGAGDGIFVGRTYVHGDYDHRALVRFDLSSLPCQARVTQASLRLSLLSVPPQVPPSSITLHPLLSSWGEGTSSDSGGRGASSESGDANWTHRLFPTTTWTTPGADFSLTPDSTTTVSAPPGTLISWPSTPFTISTANAWIQSPATNFGWLLLADESRLGTVRKFGSRENGDLDSRPILHLEYTICIADFDCSGTTNVQDIFRFLSAWFAAEPTADINNSGALNIADIFDFLAAWFAGC